jgi:hypothetical protein
MDVCLQCHGPFQAYEEFEKTLTSLGWGTKKKIHEVRESLVELNWTRMRCRNAEGRGTETSLEL